MGLRKGRHHLCPPTDGLRWLQEMRSGEVTVSGRPDLQRETDVLAELQDGSLRSFLEPTDWCFVAVWLQIAATQSEELARSVKNKGCVNIYNYTKKKKINNTIFWQLITNTSLCSRVMSLPTLMQITILCFNILLNCECTIFTFKIVLFSIFVFIFEIYLWLN